MTVYTIHAGDNATDLGQVGTSRTIIGARRIGRRAVRTMLPNGCGTYTVRAIEGAVVERGERSIRTDHDFVVL